MLVAVNMCVLGTRVIGDPHFMVPLLSEEILCYSVQGYPGLAFNLIYNEHFIINAYFVDSIKGKSQATWIGKLAIIPRNNVNSNCDQACENRACGHMIFPYFFNFSELITFYPNMLWQ